MIAIRAGVALLSVVTLALAGCAGPGGSAPSASSGRSGHAGSATPKPHTLVFSVAGKGHVGTLTYVVDGKKTTRHSVELPWKETVHVPPRVGGHDFDLRTRHVNGTATFTVYVDGHSYGGTTCSGADCGGDSGVTVPD